ncbi:MAG: histidine phosphatase family protein [Anaerolineales bacterium]|jgi:2,3-bisphosphoglycerate-dependent phosphoglycerate mutase|nr:MAG: histidine phosphatase family protein [Anaerolineales bacterium]
MKDEIHITLLRHGRSRADDEQVHEGRYDSPLTETGRSQAQARAQDFLTRGFQFDAIVASTLIRAHETADIIGAALKVPVETDPDWMEFDNGPLAGLPYTVAEERYPTPQFRNPYEPFCGTGESDWDTHCRAAKAVEKIIRRGVGTYLVTAHGGILNAALRGIIGTPPFSWLHGTMFVFGDTGYIRLVYRPSRNQWRVLEFIPGF